jgi:hypothetical protein
MLSNCYVEWLFMLSDCLCWVTVYVEWLFMLSDCLCWVTVYVEWLLLLSNCYVEWLLVLSNGAWGNFKFNFRPCYNFPSYWPTPQQFPHYPFPPPNVPSNLLRSGAVIPDSAFVGFRNGRECRSKCFVYIGPHHFEWRRTYISRFREQSSCGVPSF